MSQHTETTAHLQYQVPAVRHLAWMCHAPQLISSGMEFVPEKYLPANTEDRLRAWDQAPESGPAILTEQPARRLGRYFERLYECLLEDLLGWQVLLRNQPVRNDGITLGELDFVVRNPLDNTIEHHEIAVKFYLGYQHTGEQGTLWYGPNSQDRLDIKAERIIAHQSQMTTRPETHQLLQSLGIEAPLRPRVFMPGYLFYPIGDSLQPPTGAPQHHLRGRWLYIGELEKMIGETERWIPLVKPHWLGPWRQLHAPDRDESAEALDAVRHAGIPRLFAVLEQSPVDGYWEETSRIFVVPDTWPRSPVRNR